MGCFIEDGKFIVSDWVSGFFLQNGLCWLVYPNADYGIYLASFIMVVMIYGPPEYFLKDLDIFSSILSTKEGLVKCSKVFCSKFSSYLIEKLILFSSFVTSA